jgi:restriction endonuclease S subunit
VSLCLYEVYLRTLASGATHKTIYMPTLEQFRICAPPRPEQERIVRRLKAQLACAEEARTAAAAQLAEIERLPGRILAHTFGDAESPAKLTNACERLTDMPEDFFSDGRNDPPPQVRKLSGLDG